MMSVYDRRRAVVYRSPSGRDFEAHGDKVDTDLSKKVAAFDALNGDGATHQDRGMEPEKYSLDFNFYGADCDLAAAEFEAAIAERGAGKLQLPDKNTFIAVQLISGSVSTNLKKDTYRKSYSVRFVRTRVLAAPESVLNSRLKANALISGAFATVGEQLAAQVDFSLVQNVATTAQNFRDFAGDIQSQTRGAVDGFLRSIDKIATDAAATVDSAAELLSFPASLNLAARVSQRVQVYEAVLKNSLQRLKAVLDLYSNDASKAKNAAVAFEAQGSCVLLGAAANLTDGNYLSRDDLDDSVSLLARMYDEYIAGIERQQVYVGSSATQQATQNCLFGVAFLLYRIAFGLRAKLTITLAQDSSLHEVLAQYYAADLGRDELAAIDFLLATNPEIEGSALVEIPKGQRLDVYV